MDNTPAKASGEMMANIDRLIQETGEPVFISSPSYAQSAEKILREAVKIRTDLLPKGHYWVALANSALGECLTTQRRYTGAEPLLLESYEALKTSQGVTNPRTQLALQRLITLYENWGKLDTASAYREKLSKR